MNMEARLSKLKYEFTKYKITNTNVTNTINLMAFIVRRRVYNHNSNDQSLERTNMYCDVFMQHLPIKIHLSKSQITKRLTSGHTTSPPCRTEGSRLGFGALLPHPVVKLMRSSPTGMITLSWDVAHAVLCPHVRGRNSPLSNRVPQRIGLGWLLLFGAHLINL